MARSQSDASANRILPISPPGVGAKNSSLPGGPDANWRTTNLDLHFPPRSLWHHRLLQILLPRGTSSLLIVSAVSNSLRRFISLFIPSATIVASIHAPVSSHHAPLQSPASTCGKASTTSISVVAFNVAGEKSGSRFSDLLGGVAMMNC